eukprot:scaffold2370_cov124-Skeletonema_menzelii.AAC.11
MRTKKKQLEEAAIDYARALFKYKGQEALDKARGQISNVIDLSNVPPQLPILKSEEQTKEGISKYVGVTLDKRTNKWRAKIRIEGKVCYIVYYENEEEAAVDYAGAVFKYKGQAALDKAGETNSSSSGPVDLRDVPPQPPIPKSKGLMKEGSSKYMGVYWGKSHNNNKWVESITRGGKQMRLGYYKNEDQAAADCARTVFNYKGKGQEMLNKSLEQDTFTMDLSDVPPQEGGPERKGGDVHDTLESLTLSIMRTRGKRQMIEADGFKLDLTDVRCSTTASDT